MNRRDFLRRLLAAPIAATLDVEKLLWIPGQMVTVPRISPAVLALVRADMETAMHTMSALIAIEIYGDYRI